MGDARLNPRQLVAILSKLDAVATQIAAVRGELIQSMAARRGMGTMAAAAAARAGRRPSRRTKR